MSNKSNTNADDFINNITLKAERNWFRAKLIGYSVGYLVITILLNNIRENASSWLIWPLIIIQFVLYFSIFVSSYQRSKSLGFNRGLSLTIFIILAAAGRVNDWELLIIPLLIIVMLTVSTKNK